MTVYVDIAEGAFLNDVLDVVRVFFGQVETSAAPLSGESAAAGLSLRVLLTRTGADRGYHISASGCITGEAFSAFKDAPDPLEQKRLKKRALKTAVYQVMKQGTGRQPPWGSLTGIRPTRLIYAQMDRGMSLDESCRFVGETFDVSEGKLNLLREIVSAQQRLPAVKKGDVEMYIGIPFCVSRCAYCSFLSGELGDGRLTGPYVEALLKELRSTLELIKSKALRLSTVYVGGGTPTSLSAEQLRLILTPVAENIAGREFTVEAGRPDTIDREKLRVLRNLGVSRISVNPQTMHDETLKRIGRRHTKLETEQAYALAREMGFDDINMDLIAGLPGEDAGLFGETLAWVGAMKPDSLTVHSLAIKHASILHLYGAPLPDGEMTAKMVDDGRRAAHAMGLTAYYMYRQKYMAGNLENTAYARPGAECLYNVRMMEETGNILALGAGGISKRVDLGHGRIVRAPNVGNIEEYIARVDEMCARKRRLWEDEG